MAGRPARVLPCGVVENLPVALQLVGAPFGENTLLAIGREFQARTEWDAFYPMEVVATQDERIALEHRGRYRPFLLFKRQPYRSVQI